jgi:hypothetical protein
MDLLKHVIVGIPLWVWPLFAILVWRGVVARYPRPTSLPRLIVQPAIFFAWAAATFLSRAAKADVASYVFVICLLVAAIWSALVVRFEEIRVDPVHGLYELPGSWAPLARALSIFLAKVAIGVLSAFQPQWAAELRVADLAVSALSAGFFIGWTYQLLRSTRHFVPSAVLR